MPFKTQAELDDALRVGTVADPTVEAAPGESGNGVADATDGNTGDTDGTAPSAPAKPEQPKAAVKRKRS
jgi:hypothetical protein